MDKNEMIYYTLRRISDKSIAFIKKGWNFMDKTESYLFELFFEKLEYEYDNDMWLVNYPEEFKSFFEYDRSGYDYLTPVCYINNFELEIIQIKLHPIISVYKDYKIPMDSRGWVRPKSSNKFHYFINEYSLCNVIHHVYDDEIIANHLDKHIDNCKNCLRKKKKFDEFVLDEFLKTTK